jgi:hypothetical protein
MLTLWSLGNATREVKTLQLRALGWDLNAIYHPLSAKLGNTFANVAWAGTSPTPSVRSRPSWVYQK